MNDRKYDDLLRFSPIKDGVGKAIHDCPPHIAVDAGEHVRIMFDGVEGRLNARKKCVAEPGLNCFVVVERCR